MMQASGCRCFFSQSCCAEFLPAIVSSFSDAPVSLRERGADRPSPRDVDVGKYAIGWGGIVFTEETAVEEYGRKTYECAGIYPDDHVLAIAGSRTSSAARAQYRPFNLVMPAEKGIQ